MLERDATRGPAWDVCDVRCVLLSTLRLPASMSLCTASELFRRMLFTLAAFLRSAAVVAVSGGLGGGRGGVGATRFGGGGITRGSLSLPVCGASTSVASGVSAADLRFSFAFAFSFSSRE